MKSLVDSLMVLGSLAFVLLLAVATLRIIKTLQSRTDQRLDLRFLHALPIGARERLVVVQWQDRLLLLGVSTGGVTVLTNSALAADADEKPADAPIGSNLARALLFRDRVSTW
jgi:flagellar protein FliO/FliZ